MFAGISGGFGDAYGDAGPGTVSEAKICSENKL